MILSKIRQFAINSHLGLLLACSFLFFSCSKDKSVTRIQKDEPRAEKLYANTLSEQYSAEDLFRGIMFMSGDVANKIPQIKEQVALIKVLNPTQESQETLQKAQDQMLEQIEIQNPGYIKNFAASILSHDHERIKDEITKAGDVIFVSISKYFKIELNAAKSAKEQIIEIFSTKQSEVEGLLTKYQLNQISKQEFENSIMNTLNIDKTQLKTLALNSKNNIDPAFAGCAVIFTLLACNVAIAINVAGYINVALAAAVAVAVAAAVFTWKWFWTADSKSNNSQLDYDKYINSIATGF